MAHMDFAWMLAVAFDQGMPRVPDICTQKAVILRSGMLAFSRSSNLPK